MAIKGVYSLQGRTRVNRVIQLSVYYNADAGTSEAFCTGAGNALITIYTPTYTTLATIYSNNAYIYTNSSLTTLASSGFYSLTNGGNGAVWYGWTSAGISSGWTSSGTCGE